MSRARPRPPEAKPFLKYERSKWVSAYEDCCIAKRERGTHSPDLRSFDALLKWQYGPRTKEEILWFGGYEDGRIKRLLCHESPFFAKISKQPFTGDVLDIPVKTGRR